MLYSENATHLSTLFSSFLFWSYPRISEGFTNPPTDKSKRRVLLIAPISTSHDKAANKLKRPQRRRPPGFSKGHGSGTSCVPNGAAVDWEGRRRFVAPPPSPDLISKNLKTILSLIFFLAHNSGPPF